MARGGPRAGSGAVIRTPAPLASWSALLAALPPTLEAGLGPWVERLLLAMGPPRAARPRVGGEPDGFSGITRRGSYERLLLTEWLLADEVPDEFARRAAMGEHAFHAIARRTPAQAATSTALFDAGPDQLGSPRILQLAALLALAGRAERAGVPFSWGMLHEPEGPMIAALTPESVLHLLDKRTAIVAGVAELDAWADRARREGWEDLWLVGRRAPPRRVGGPAWTPASIEAEDLLDPERRAVRAVVSLPARLPRAIELDLPDERACAQLLRDPFAGVRSPPRRGPLSAAAGSNLLFAANGAKVFLRAKGGEILAYPVPNHPSTTPGRPKRYRSKAEGVVAAVGWLRRGLVMLTVNGRTFTLEQTNRQGPSELSVTFRLPAGAGFAAPTLDDPLAPLVFHSFGPRVIPLTLDARGALYELSEFFDPPVSRVASEVALLFNGSRDHVAFVARGVDPQGTVAGARLVQKGDTRLVEPAAFHLAVLGGPEKAGPFIALEGEAPFEVVFGFRQQAPAFSALVAVREVGSTWKIHGAARPIAIAIDDGARVVGVSQLGAEAEPELWVIEPDRRTLSLRRRGSSRALARASSDIVHFAQCTSRPTMAYATETGEVVIHSSSFAQPLARYLPPEGR